MKKRQILAIGLAMVAPWGMAADAPAFPDKPIRLIVPFGPGGGGDIIGRTWAKYMSMEPGINVVVENKAGAGGAIGTTAVARAKADGYTLLLGTSTTQIINPAVSPAPTYDGMADFALVDMISTNPTCIIVNPKFPASNVKELIALVQANPGKYAYGSAGPGTITNLTGELFKFKAGKLALQHAAYKGGGPAMADLIAGHIPIITPILSSSVLALHRAGKAKIIAVNSQTRLKAAPDIPTAMEQGLDDMRVEVFNAVFAPAGTPQAVMSMLAAASQKVMTNPSFIKDLEKAGAELLSPADPKAYVMQEAARWKDLIKVIGFRL